MPDIRKLLWPESVAIIGASSDTRGLRGRIVQILRSHPYAGAVFGNTAASLCPTFSPAMDPGDVPLLPAKERTRGQVAVISQSGGMGFAFFDHGRPKELSFRYIVTTGNEACLEASDFAEFIVDEGKTDPILMLIEDLKNPTTFERMAEKALRAGKPLVVNR